MKGMTTYLHFNGNCRGAMEFYRQCFGGELEVMAYPDASGKMDEDAGAPVMHSRLGQGERTLLMASDYRPGTDPSGLANNFSVFIECGSNGEVDELFAALVEGGKVTVPPSEMASGRFGMCDDRYGVSWILNCAAAG